MSIIRRLRTNFFSRILFRVRVHGESAWPLLMPGGTYIATNLFPPRKGDFIVFPDPASPQQFLVKRVTKSSEGSYTVESVISWGRSSKDFGRIPRQAILGKLIGRARTQKF